MFEKLCENLKFYGQEHLVGFWGELNDLQKSVLLKQLDEIDWKELDSLIKSYVLKKPENNIPEDLAPAPYFPLVPENNEQANYYIKAIEKGKHLLKNGEVAAFTVAGGQGTRLGFDGPKGTFPITPIKGKTLFQYFAESLKRASEKYMTNIPWYIMTSEMNDQATRIFFKENSYFGLDKECVMFFKQGTMPAISHEGKVLLDKKYSIALAPNGHGGSLLALRNSGALKDMDDRGIKYISYFQVDNPLVSVVNPLLIGLHFLEKSNMSSIMLSKTGPFEKLGNFCISDGKLMIIEYSDMPKELAEKIDESGKLCFIAGSPAIHVISREFIESLTSDGNISLPWHRADKKVAFINAKGEGIQPEEVNAVKLETFIFDALTLAGKTIILEAAREDEFAPTKNKTGVDSVQSCREMLIKRDAERLEKVVGLDLPKSADGKLNCIVELSPLRYFDEEDVRNAIEELLLKIPKPGEKVYYE